MSPRRKPAKKKPARPPKRARRNPTAAGLKELAAAQRMSQTFHGTKTEVVELSAKERKPLPRYAVVLGHLDDLTYAPDASSKRGAYKWRHESGDRGMGKAKSPNAPLVVVDPRTKRPAIVMDKSPMRLSSKRGLVG